MNDFLIGEEFSWIECGGGEMILFNANLGEGFHFDSFTAGVFRACSKGLRCPQAIANRLAELADQGEDVLALVEDRLSYLSRQRLITGLEMS